MFQKILVAFLFFGVVNSNTEVNEFSVSSIGPGQTASFVPILDISLPMKGINENGGGLRGKDVEEDLETETQVYGSSSEQNSRMQAAIIRNNCRTSYYVSLVYESGDVLIASSRNRLNSQESLAVEGITNSKIWIYGSSLSFFSENVSSENSRFCVGGECYREVDLGSLTGRNIEYWMCDGTAASKKTKRDIQIVTTNTTEADSALSSAISATLASLGANQKQTLEPSQNPTRSPTLRPTKNPTFSPTPIPTLRATDKITPVPTPDPTSDPSPAPTRFPSPAPTRFPTPNPTRFPTLNPTRFPTPDPTRFPTLNPTRNPVIIPSDEQSFKEQWLSAHNSRRESFYALFGMSPLHLRWSNSVTESAQNYADKLIARDGCVIEHGYDDDSYGGENLAMNYGSGRYAIPRTPEEVMNAWYDREIDLDAMQLVGQKYHASQVVFRSSRYVGCAEASKEMGNGAKCFIQVCRYIGVGNCFIESHASHPLVSAALPPNCISDHPDWVCSVLSDTASSFCSDNQCPLEGCIE